MTALFLCLGISVLGLAETAEAADISINDVVLTETDSGTTTATFKISLDKQEGSDIKLQYSTSDGSATAGQDYVSITDTVTIPAGSENILIDITVNGDKVVEGDETFRVTLSIVTGPGLITDGTGVCTIENNDSAVLTVGNVTQPEDGGNMTFTVKLSAAVQGGLKVDYGTADITATGGSDYTVANGTLMNDLGCN